MLGAAIGLGILSAANSIYQNHKRNEQVDRANDINENAAQLSYDAQMKTNEQNYQIFKESQEYNSPANLKSMYDALGLNGDAIVANQGFVPTAAPVMDAPHMDQVNFQSYEKANPIDSALSSMLSAFSSAKIQKEIDKVGEEMALTKAKTEECRQSTKNLALDYVLKDQKISEADIEYMMKTREFEQLNLQNANLMILNEKMNQEMEQNKDIHSKLLRMYDDKHALDAAQAAITKFKLDHVAEEFTAMIKKAYSEIRLNISNSKHVDLLAIGQDIANYVAGATKHARIATESYKADEEKYKRDAEYYEFVEKAKKYGWLNPSEDDNVIVRMLGTLLSGYSVGFDILAEPLKGLIGGSVVRKM